MEIISHREKIKVTIIGAWIEAGRSNGNDGRSHPRSTSKRQGRAEKTRGDHEQRDLLAVEMRRARLA
jgi:hypothetical protein